MKLFLQLLTFDDISNSHIQDTTGSGNGQGGGTRTTPAASSRVETRTFGWVQLQCQQLSKRQVFSSSQQLVAPAVMLWGHFLKYSGTSSSEKSTDCFRCQKQLQSSNELPHTDISQPQGTVAALLCHSSAIIFPCPFPHKALLPAFYCCRSSFLFRREVWTILFCACPAEWHSLPA